MSKKTRYTISGLKRRRAALTLTNRAPVGNARLSALDPSRTVTERRQMAAMVERKFARIKGALLKLVVTEDAFGLGETTANSNPEGCNQYTGPGCGGQALDGSNLDKISLLAAELTEEMRSHDELSFSLSKMEQYQWGTLARKETMLDELARGGFDTDRTGSWVGSPGLARKTYEHFRPLRDAIRDVVGDHVTLYRGADATGGVPGKKLSSYAPQKKVAEKFMRGWDIEGKPIEKILKEVQVPVDAIYVAIKTKDRPLEFLIDNDKLPRHLAANLSAADVDLAAREAIGHEDATDAMKEAGTYKKAHIRLHGLGIAIENPKGSRRKDGFQPLASHYGYIKSHRDFSTVSDADGDHVDCFLGPHPESELVVVVDQYRDCRPVTDNSNPDQPRDDNGRWVGHDVTVPLSKIVLDDRLKQDAGNVDSIRESIRSGKPIKAVYLTPQEDGTYFVQDGHHRILAAWAEGLSSVGAKFHVTDNPRELAEQILADAKKWLSTNAARCFDEHKVMLGYRSAAEAKAGYLANYPPGWAGFGGMKAMSVDAFKRWLAEGDTGRPVADQLVTHAAGIAVPDVRQETEYDCGRAVLLGLTRHFHAGPQTMGGVAEVLPTTSHSGTDPRRMTSALTQLGLTADPFRDSPELDVLGAHLRAGRPVLCLVQTYGGVGHWVTATGLDSDSVSYNDPWSGPARLPRRDWAAQWRDRDTEGNPLVRYGIAVGRAALVENSNPEGCNQYTGPGCGADNPEKDAVAHYQEDAYVGINETLRGRPEIGMDEKEKKTFAVIDRLTKTEPIGRTVLFRGLDGPSAIKFLADIGFDPKEYERNRYQFVKAETLKAIGRSMNLSDEVLAEVAARQGVDLKKSGQPGGSSVVGKEVKDDGFLSTSRKASIAKEFANDRGKGGGENQVVIEIHTHARQTGLDTAKHSDEETHEVVLPRGTTLRITGIEPGQEKGWRVYAETIARPTANRFQFRTSPDKLQEFQSWLRGQFDAELTGKGDKELWARYIQVGYAKGAGRAFEDVHKPLTRLAVRKYKDAKGRVREAPAAVDDFYAGSREQFLRSSFAAPETVEKVQLLAGRTFDELKNVTHGMSTKMSRVLSDGLVQGKNPWEVARLLNREVDLGRNRALTISRTELLRAHNEGALDALEALGADEVGVAVEITPAGEPCELCAHLQGVVLTIAEARGVCPVHPNCLCVPIPANVGESGEGQKASKAAIDRAMRASGTTPGRPIAKVRPLWTGGVPMPLTNAAEGDNCGTGAGGFQPGNTCGATKGKTYSTLADVKAARDGEPGAADKVVRDNAGLVHYFAKRYARPGTDQYADLVQEGSVGLLTAVRKYDPAKGTQFGTYAWQWVRAKVRTAAVKAHRAKERERQEAEDADGRKRHEPADHRRGNAPDVDEAREEVTRSLGLLDARGRDVIARRYGLDGHAPATQAEVGRHLGVTKMRVSQLEAAALKRLRGAVTANALAAVIWGSWRATENKHDGRRSTTERADGRVADSTVPNGSIPEDCSGRSTHVPGRGQLGADGFDGPPEDRPAAPKELGYTRNSTDDQPRDESGRWVMEGSGVHRYIHPSGHYVVKDVSRDVGRKLWHIAPVDADAHWSQHGHPSDAASTLKEAKQLIEGYI